MSADSSPPSQAADTVLSVDELAARITALPDVAVTVADEQSGVPESMWGARFFFAGSQRMMPFATVVEHDTPGWDEDSRLDRSGVYRLNIQLGRDEFRNSFGYPPADFADHRGDVDFTRLDRLLPHPLYGRQGWACILNPTAGRLPEVDRLLRHAHHRAHRATSHAEQD